MPEATINGNNICYRDVGEGFPIVLIHGFTGNSRNWALTVPALRDRFRCVSIDLRGHGLSFKPAKREDYSFELMADDVWGLMQHLAIGRAIVVGHSMGGMVAQHIALDHPAAVPALVLVDTAASLPEGLAAENRRNQRSKLFEIARTQGMEAAFEEQLRITPDAERLRENPEYIRIWREQFLMTSPEAYIYCGHGLATRRPVLTELASVRVPTLIICGERDEPFLAPSQEMHEAVPGSDLVIIESAGHAPQMETPAEFNRVLVAFLDRVLVTSRAV